MVIAKLAVPVAALALLGYTAAALPANGDSGPSSSLSGTGESQATVTVAATWHGRDAQRWAAMYRQARRDSNARGRTVARLKRSLTGSTSVQEAIRLASVVYHIPWSTLHRKAFCESRFSPAARNPSGAMGLYQFLGSTWRSTPFAGFSPYDPLAASLAAGWMHVVGRGGEWSCR